MKLACEALVQGTYSTWLSLLARLTTENMRFSELDGGVRFIAASGTLRQRVALLERLGRCVEREWLSKGLLVHRQLMLPRGAACFDVPAVRQGQQGRSSVGSSSRDPWRSLSICTW